MRKKNTYGHLLLGLLALLVIACKDKDEKGGIAPTPVSLKAGIYTIQAEEGSVWKAGEEFGVFMLKNGTSQVVADYANLLHTADDYSATGYLVPDGEPMYYPTDGSLVDFIAYHPYDAQAGNTRASGYIVSFDLTNQQKASPDDFIYSNEGRGRSASGGSYELQLKPVLAQVVVELVPGSGYTDDDLKARDVTLRHMPVKAAFNLLEGRFLSPETSADVVLKAVTGAAARREVVLLPGEVPDDMVLAVDMEAGGQPFSLTGRLNSVVPHAEANTRYEVRVKVTPDGLEPTLVSTSPIYVLDWQNDGDNVDEEIVEGIPNLVKDGALDNLKAEQLQTVTAVPATPHMWYGMANQVEGTFDVYRDRQQGNVLSMSFAGTLAWYKNYLGYTSTEAQAAHYQLTFKMRSSVAGAKLQTYVRIAKQGNHFFVLKDADTTKACAARVLEATTEWTTYVVDFDFTRTVNTIYASGLQITPSTDDDRNSFYVAFVPQQAGVEYVLDDVTFMLNQK
ncbi:MAG: fimbrillin family protein [Bacteroides sp.]|nr:fimbrillin family protein [Bacteroides sp.]